MRNDCQSTTSPPDHQTDRIGTNLQPVRPCAAIGTHWHRYHSNNALTRPHRDWCGEVGRGISNPLRKQ